MTRRATIGVAATVTVTAAGIAAAILLSLGIMSSGATTSGPGSFEPTAVHLAPRSTLPANGSSGSSGVDTDSSTTAPASTATPSTSLDPGDDDQGVNGGAADDQGVNSGRVDDRHGAPGDDVSDGRGHRGDGRHDDD